jgi:hypothetical protein
MKSRHCFTKLGAVYVPKNTTGWSPTALTWVTAICTFVIVDKHSHSVSDTLIGAIPIIANLFLLLWLVAAQSSRPSNSFSLISYRLRRVRQVWAECPSSSGMGHQICAVAWQMLLLPLATLFGGRIGMWRS